MLLAASIAIVAATCAQLATAHWTSTGTGTGSATTATMPGGIAPSGSPSGTTVTVSIDQISVAGFYIGALGGEYTVTRYPAAGGGGVTPPAGTCSTPVTGPAATLNCTETSTPRGDWVYTVTPVLFGWTSAESPVSSTVIVEPDPASGLGATLAPAAEIDLAWSAGPGATGYNVYRRDTLGSYNFASPVNGGTPVAGTNFTDTTAVDGSSYNYVVRSVVIGSFGQQIESTNSNETAAIVADGTAPTATADNPGAYVRGTINLSGSASDGGSGLASLDLEGRAVGNPTWGSICGSSVSSPINCLNYDTTLIPDDDYEIRVTATDNAGNTGISPVITPIVVDNTAPTITMNSPGTYMNDGVTLTSVASDATAGVASVQYQYRLNPAGPWLDTCSSTTPPFSCVNTASFTHNTLYDLQAIATDNAGNTATSPVILGVRADNVAPTAVTINDPGSPVRGTISLSGTASDALAGIANVTYQYQVSSGGPWSDACTGVPPSPFTCNFDTTTTGDEVYDLRAVATDNAGNTTTSAEVLNRRIDNTPPAVNLTSPGARIRATVTLNATASDTGGSGVASVTFRHRVSPAGPWTTIATDNTAPYSTNFDTTLVTDGTYDLSALATDVAGNTNESIVTVVIDNTRPTASDIQIVNGGGTVGMPDTGDTVTYTFSEAMDPNSILAGWTGSSTTVTLRLSNNGGNDRIRIWDAANTTQTTLGQVRTGGNYVTAARTFTSSTMVMSGNTIIVTLGTPSGAVNTVAGNANARWDPVTGALDLAGNQMMTTARIETGAADPNF
jgi:hypothetical protein